MQILVLATNKIFSCKKKKEKKEKNKRRRNNCKTSYDKIEKILRNYFIFLYLKDMNYFS